MVLPKVKKTTLVDKIVKIIIDRINNNEFKVGDVFPSEIEMSKQLGVSRATIRESTAYLIGMGVLERNENGLEIIQSPSSAVFNNLSSFIDIGLKTQSLYEARIFFDIGFVYLASLKVTEKDINRLEELNRNIQDNVNNEELYWKSDLEFHYEIARIVDNELLFSIYETIMKLFTTYLENDGKSIFKQKEVVNNTPNSHQILIDALKSGNSIDAIDTVIHSLDNAMKDMISRKIRQAMPKQ